jgi:hypothetical protein
VEVGDEGVAGADMEVIMSRERGAVVEGEVEAAVEVEVEVGSKCSQVSTVLLYCL